MLKKFLLFVLFATMTISCGNRRQSVFYLPEKAKAVKVVAVLPFENLTSDENAAEVVTALFAAELAKSGKFKILEASEVRQRLQAKQVVLAPTVARASAKKIAETLGVDAVFSGSVLEYAYLREIREGKVVAREPVVGLQVRLIDSSKGELLWSAVHSRSGNSLILSNQDTIQTTASSAISALLQSLK